MTEKRVPTDWLNTTPTPEIGDRSATLIRPEDQFRERTPERELLEEIRGRLAAPSVIEPDQPKRKLRRISSPVTDWALAVEEKHRQKPRHKSLRAALIAACKGRCDQNGHALSAASCQQLVYQFHVTKATRNEK